MMPTAMAVEQWNWEIGITFRPWIIMFMLLDHYYCYGREWIIIIWVLLHSRKQAYYYLMLHPRAELRFTYAIFGGKLLRWSDSPSGRNAVDTRKLPQPENERERGGKLTKKINKINCAVPWCAFNFQINWRLSLSLTFSLFFSLLVHAIYVRNVETHLWCCRLTNTLELQTLSTCFIWRREWIDIDK